MKAEFKKNWRNPALLYPFLFGILVWLAFLGCIAWLWNLTWVNITVWVIIPLPTLITMLMPYRITDTNNLENGSAILNILLISRIERLERGGFRIFYGWQAAGKVRKARFFPKEESAFLNKLLEINPNIQMNLNLKT